MVEPALAGHERHNRVLWKGRWWVEWLGLGLGKFALIATYMLGARPVRCLRSELR